MSDDLSYLDEAEAQAPTALGEVMRLVDALLHAQARVEEAEEELAARKAVEKQLREVTIPDIMAQNRLSVLKLDNGKVVEIKEDLACSIPKEDEAKRKIIFDWLYANEGGEYVKDVVSVEDLDDDIIEMLKERAITFDRSKSVNANSFKAFLKRMLGMTKNTLQRIRKEDIPVEANVYIYRTTKVTG